ncbi:MAG: hypothetical protein HQL64_08440 [Magnetococcales bacterium]|nr:hypothetical protein [Magnetococcales bacterium]
MLQNESRKAPHPAPVKSIRAEKPVRSPQRPPGKLQKGERPVKGRAPEIIANGGKHPVQDRHAPVEHTHDAHPHHDVHPRAEHGRSAAENDASGGEHHARAVHPHDRGHHLDPAQSVVHHRAHKEESEEEEDLRKELEILIKKNADRKKRQLLFLFVYVSLFLPVSYYAFAYFKMVDRPAEATTEAQEAAIVRKKPDIARTVILDTKSSLAGSLSAHETIPMNVVETTPKPNDATGSGQVLRVEKGPILITNVQVGRDSQGRLHLRGELFNRGKVPIDQATLRVLFPDQDGSPLLVQQIDPLVTQSWVLGEVSAPLEAGTSRTFDTEITNVPSNWSGNVQMDITRYEVVEPKSGEKPTSPNKVVTTDSLSG